MFCNESRQMPHLPGIQIVSTRMRYLRIRIRGIILDGCPGRYGDFIPSLVDGNPLFIYRHEYRKMGDAFPVRNGILVTDGIRIRGGRYVIDGILILGQTGGQGLGHQVRLLQFGNDLAAMRNGSGKG